MSKSKRGPSPDEFTKNLLCARSAGRCQFCNKILFTDTFTLKDNNNSNLAHIVASSPDGPRGDVERSYQLSNKIENLMLMCLDHHHLIDSHPEIYTEEILQQMKNNHERKVQALLNTITCVETEMILFSAKIKNDLPVTITPKEAVQAFVGVKRPKSLTGIRIDVTSTEDYHSTEYWEQQTNNIRYYFRHEIKSAIEFDPAITFSVFPLAPIPLVMFLGYIMGDKISADVYQKSRDSNTWIWQSDNRSAEFDIHKEVLGKGTNIGLIISISGEVSCEQVLSSCPELDVIYTISAKEISVDCIKSEKDLSAFWHEYQKLCDTIKNDYPDIDNMSIFPAIPVSAAFEIGRRHMLGVYPKLRVFDNDNGFFETLTIGDKQI